MANQKFDDLAQSARDAGYQERLRIAMSATALSIAAPGSTQSAPRQALAKQVIQSGDQYAKDWAYAVRVSGSNITKAAVDLTDTDITAGVEALFAVYAGT